MAEKIDQNVDNHRLSFSTHVHQYLTNYVTVADAKASGLLIINLAIISLLIESQPLINMTLCWISIIGYSISSLISIWVIFPRLPSERNGLIFWEDILSRETPEQYTEEFSSIDTKNIISECAKENWYISSVLHKKYKIISYGIAVFVLSSILGLLSIWS